MKYLLEMKHYLDKNKITSTDLDFYLHSPKYEAIRFTEAEINNLKTLLGAFDFKHDLDEFEEKIIFSKFDEQIYFTFFKVQDKNKNQFYLLSYRNFMKSNHYKFEDWFHLEVFTRKMKSEP